MNKSYWHFKLGIILMSIFFILICLEISVRLFIKPPPAIIVENLNKGNNLELRYPLWDDGLYINTPTGFRMKTNTKVKIKSSYPGEPDIEVTTNSLGFRHEELKEKQPDEFRILVLGDSITIADYLPNEQTYPSRIAHYLKSARISFNGKRKYVVINAGIGAVDLETEYAILLERGLKAKPDIVLVGLYLNDAYQSPKLKMTLLPPILQASYFLRVLFNRIDKLRVMYHAYERKSTQNQTILKDRGEYFRFHKKNKDGSIVWNNKLEPEIHYTFDDWGYAWSDKFWDKILPLIDMLKQTATDENFKLVIVFFPVAHQITYKDAGNEPQQRFADEMSRRNIFHLDLLPLLKGKYNRDGVNLFKDHCHYSKEGCDFTGKSIADFLKQAVLNK